MSAYIAAPGQHVCVCPPGNGGYLQETTSESSWEVGGQGPKHHHLQRCDQMRPHVLVFA